jgi:hypothetical protein
LDTVVRQAGPLGGRRTAVENCFKLTNLRHYLIVVVILMGCSCERGPTTSAPAIPTVYAKENYEKGYVRFVDPPNTTFRVRGKMEVTIWDKYIKVEKDDGNVFYIPIDLVIYVGKEIEGD